MAEDDGPKSDEYLTDDEAKCEEYPEPLGDEIDIVVEKGSPEDNLLQVLKNKGIDAEITAWAARGGTGGKFQLVEIQTRVTRHDVVPACAIWAVVLPSGRPYLLSAWGPGETPFPLDPNLMEKLVNTGPGTGATDDDKDSEGGATL